MLYQNLSELLQKCTVRLNIGYVQGTGFFVAPNLVVTCAHVIGEVESSLIELFWKIKGKKYKIEVLKIAETVDLALLKIVNEQFDHPCVYFDYAKPQVNDDLYVFGYPGYLSSSADYSNGDSVTLKFEGDCFKDDLALYKLKSGEIIEGFSGSPLLNLRTRRVCGVVHLSRSGTEGGRAIPIESILSEFEGLKELHEQFHRNNNQWIQNLEPNVETTYRNTSSESKNGFHDLILLIKRFGFLENLDAVYSAQVLQRLKIARKEKSDFTSTELKIFELVVVYCCYYLKHRNIYVKEFKDMKQKDYYSYIAKAVNSRELIRSQQNAKLSSIIKDHTISKLVMELEQSNEPK